MARDGIVLSAVLLMCFLIST